MIMYTEKGVGQHTAIRAAGEWLKQENGVWLSSDDAAVQSIMDAYVAPDPLVAAKASKSREVSLHAKRLRDKVVETISAGEMASWPIKRAEADAYAADNTAVCPMLAAEASQRGVTLESMVARVRSNSDRFGAAEAAIGGTDGKHRDAIVALTTCDQVLSYDFNTGWPAV